MNRALRVLSAAVFAIACTRAHAQCDGTWHAGHAFANHASVALPYQGDLYVGGDNYMIEAGNTLAHYDGGAWTPIPDMFSEIFALAAFNGDLIAGGRIYNHTSFVGLARWNQAQGWQSVGAGLNNYVHCLTVYNNRLIAGGEFGRSGQTPPALYRVAAWDGTQWTALGLGISSGGNSVLAMTVLGNDLVVAGSFPAAGNVNAQNIARWNGSSWSAMGAGLNYEVDALTVYNNQVIAAGMFTASGSTPLTGHLARWDGAAWRPLDGFPTDPYTAPRRLTTFQGRLIVAGSIRLEPTGRTWAFVSWDGSSWRPMSVTQPSSAEYGMAEFAGQLFVVGSGGYIGREPYRGFVRWTTPSADFNHDGSPGTDQDIEDFFACLAGNCCPLCDSADFNGDGDVATDADIEAFFRVLAGGSC